MNRRKLFKGLERLTQLFAGKTKILATLRIDNAAILQLLHRGQHLSASNLRQSRNPWKRVGVEIFPG